MTVPVGNELAPHPAEQPRAGIRLSFPSIDDCLGPASERFFGTGYRGVRYTVGDTQFEQQRAGATLRAVAGVAHPVEWSRKVAGTAKPHLTTVDCVLLGIRAANVCVGRAFELNHRQRRASWPARIDIRSAGRPMEERLDAVRITSQLATPPRHSAAGIVSVLDGRVATMRTRVEMVHEDGPATRSGQPGTVPGHLLGDGHPGVYGSAFRNHGQTIRHLVLDLGDRVARAEVELGAADHRSGQRKGAACARAATMLDGFLVTMQLGQALLYETDGIHRRDSGTLWMRGTTIRVVRPATTSLGSAGVRVALHDVELLHTRGETWRTAVIEGDLHGINIRCAVAHRLTDAMGAGLTAGAS